MCLRKNALAQHEARVAAAGAQGARGGEGALATVSPGSAETRTNQGWAQEVQGCTPRDHDAAMGYEAASIT